MLKTILKISAIVVLTGGLVAVSVMKSSISAKKQAGELERLKEQYYAERDSVYLRQLDDSTKFYVDSILKVELFYGHQIDSLNKYFDSLLRAKDTSQKVNGQKKKVQNSLAKELGITDSAVTAIKSNYKKLIADLPGDLTPYEKKVSIKEIVVSLSREYKISPESINRIVK